VIDIFKDKKNAAGLVVWANKKKKRRQKESWTV